MPLKFPIAIVAVVAVLVMGDGASVPGAMSQQEFLAQYGPAAERLQRFYSHMTLEATITRSALELKKPVIERQRLVVHTDGDRLRIERFVPDGSGGESVRVVVTSPDNSFTVRREAGQENFVLSGLSSDSIRSTKILRSQHYYIFAPFCENGGLILADKFRSKNIRITSIEEEERNGEVLVKVAYERDIKYNNTSATYSGYDVFSKTMCWALRESVAGGDEVQQRGMIEYKGTVDGVPLLNSAEYWRQRGDKRVNILRCEVTKIEPEVAPAELFELASLVRDVRQEKKSSYWLLLIVGGVVLIAIAIVLARLAAYRRAAV